MLIHRCQLVGRGKVVKTCQVLSPRNGEFGPHDLAEMGVRFLGQQSAELVQIRNRDERLMVRGAGQQYRRHLYGGARRLRLFRLG